MELDIRHFRYFLTLVEEASFTRAAARLGIAQSALSSQIQRVERHLGTELVRRGRRRLELTAAGEAFAVRARNILALVRAAETAARTEHSTVPLRVGCFRAAWWPQQLSRAIEDHVDAVTANTETVDPERGLEQLADGVLDVCVCFDFAILPARVPPGVRVAGVLLEPTWVVLPAGHPGADEEQVALGTLAGDDWLVQPRGTYLRQVVENICHEAGFTPRTVAAGDSWELTQLVTQGRGVTLCPPTIAATDNFVTRPVEPVHWRRIFVAWRPDRSTEATARQVVAAVAHLYQEQLRHVTGTPRSPYAEPRMCPVEAWPPATGPEHVSP